MNKLNINIRGACEIKWANNGDLVNNTHMFIYTGREKMIKE